MLTGLALIWMPGCGLLSTGNYLDRELACGSNPHDWWGTLTRYVDQGNGEGGFDLDPPAEEYIARVQGKYDLDNGDLAFSREYSNRHYFVQEVGRGYGIVDRNGDLDVIYKLEHEDVLGEAWTTEIHEVREGCYGTVTELFSDVEGDEDVLEYRIVADDEVKIHYVTVIGQDEETTDGSDYADGTGTRTQTYESTGYAYNRETALRADGGRTTTWEQFDFDREFDYYGEDVWSVDGSRVRDYTVNTPGETDERATYHGERAYDGSGTGTVTYATGGSCDYTFNDWNSCTYECSDGKSGTC